MWSNLAFAAGLMVVSIGMLVGHWQAWQAHAVRRLAKREREHLHRQYRRRTQASALIGVVGLAVAGGTWVSELRWMLLYWSVVSLLVLWMGCLAMVDLFSTRAYFKLVHQDYAVEHQALKAELDQLRGSQSNGQKLAEPKGPLRNEEDN